MIAEICAIREKLFSCSIQNVLQNFGTQIFLGIIVSKCNQSVQVFSCSHFLMPQQRELSEQVNSMKMIFTLNLKNSKREATLKVSLFIGSVLTGIATRGLFRKLCVKRHKVQVLKMLWPNLRDQGDQNSMTQVRPWYN